MSDINALVLIGNLCRDANLEYLKGSNTAKASFSIAVNRDVKRGDSWEKEASYFDVVYFGKAAEALKPYLLKGKKIGINGHLQQDRWEKDGKKNSRVYVVAEDLNLLGGNPNGNNSQNAAAAPMPAANPAPVNLPPVPEETGFPSDIPF